MLRTRLLRYDLIDTKKAEYLGLFGGSRIESREYPHAFRGMIKVGKGMADGLTRVPVNYEKDDYGRYHCIDDNRDRVCIQTMNRAVRNFVVSPNAQDIDMVNCAPTLLVQLLEKNGKACPSLRYFVDHYDECMEQIKTASRHDPKYIKNIMLFGAGITDEGLPVVVKNANSEVKAAYDGMKGDHPFLDRRARIRDEEKKEEFEMASRKKRRTEGGNDGGRYISNVAGLFMNYLYQNLEGKMLMALDEAGREAGMWGDEVSLIHDGIMVHRGDQLGESDLKMLEDLVMAKTGYKVGLKKKALLPAMELDVSVLPERIVLGPTDDDRVAANIVKLALAGNYMVDNNTQYAKIDGLWTSRKEEVKKHLFKTISNMDIWKVVPRKDEEVEVSVSGNSVQAGHILQMVVAQHNIPMVDNFAKKVVLGGHHKVAFRDGYYEFYSDERNGKLGGFVFAGEFDTFNRVSRPFPKRVQRDIDFVMETIINPIFTNTESGLKEVFLSSVARALAGDLDKVTNIVFGPRNSGKSILFQFLENAFESYCGLVPSTCMVASDGGTDPFRNCSFMSDAELARIIKLPELPVSNTRHVTKIDGNKMKVFQSMKEGVMARPLYCNQRLYYSLGTGFMLMNDIPEFVPLDSMERCNFFCLPNEFVTDAEKRDDPFNGKKLLQKVEIESLIRERKNIDALVHIVIEAYSNVPIVPLPSMKRAKEEAMIGQGDELYLDILEVSTNRDDIVLVKDAKKALQGSGITDGPTAIGMTVVRLVEKHFKELGMEAPSQDEIKMQSGKRDHTRNKTIFRYVRFKEQMRFEERRESNQRGIDENVNDNGAMAYNFFTNQR